VENEKVRPVCIYVDNSNIFIGGKETARSRGEDPENFRISFRNFLSLVTSGTMQFNELVWAGSGDADTETIFNGFREKGIDLQLIPRAENGENETVDMAMQLAMYRHARKYRDNAGLMILCTGDGKGYDHEKGFVYDMKGFIDDGWQFTLFSWEGICHRDLKKLASEKGVYVPLDDYYDFITFIKDGREAKPIEFGIE
jgi:hypothetical protein